jgi:hypothetical protein
LTPRMVQKLRSTGSDASILKEKMISGVSRDKFIMFPSPDKLNKLLADIGESLSTSHT